MRAIRSRDIAPGLAALGAVGLLLGGALAGLLGAGAGNFAAAFAAFDPYIGRVVVFTLWQAALSTLLSVVPALVVARALSRSPDFPGRGLVLSLFAVPLALPAIVAASGILALLGRAGLLSGPLSAMTEGRWPGIYGLSGILLAHVFFNMPLATRLFLEALDTVPENQRKLAAQLGMGSGATFRLIEWPVLRAALSGAAGLVFMLCVTSFTIVLTLGGGPKATTLEVAIYQALRFDFDPPRAVALTLLQVAISAISLYLLSRLGAGVANDPAAPAGRAYSRPTRTAETAFNTLVIAVAAVLVAAPLAAIVVSGLRSDIGRLVADGAVQSATLTSVGLGCLSAILALLMSFSIVSTRWKLAGSEKGRFVHLLEGFIGNGASFVLVVPPIVIGAGWFLLLRGHIDVLSAAPFMVVAVNAVMAMPFTLRAIRPAHDAAAARHDRLSSQLGIKGWNRLRLIDFPVLRRPLLTGFVFAMALSLGDLGVIALFGSDAVQTLPYLLLGRMGSYRTDDAAGLALLLGALCLGLMLLADWLGRRAQ